MAYFHAETDFGSTTAMASGLFSNKQHAEQFLGMWLVKSPWLKHRVVELQQVPDGWTVSGDLLLAELRNKAPGTPDDLLIRDWLLRRAVTEDCADCGRAVDLRDAQLVCGECPRHDISDLLQRAVRHLAPRNSGPLQNDAGDRVMTDMREVLRGL